MTNLKITENTTPNFMFPIVTKDDQPAKAGLIWLTTAIKGWLLSEFQIFVEAQSPQHHATPPSIIVWGATEKTWTVANLYHRLYISIYYN